MIVILARVANWKHLIGTGVLISTFDKHFIIFDIVL